jgi:hypothetical protein
MRKCISVFIALLIITFLLPAGSWASWPDMPRADTWNVKITRKIIYPWRATTAIVKPEASFEVWFKADQGQTIESIILKGPYNTVTCPNSIMNGNWVYDPLSGNTYNTKITATVPAGTPDDRYDLIVKTSQGDEVSWGGVKVIKEHKENYYLMHISDGHLFQGGYDSKVILARKSEMIDMANIMDVPIIIETGDNMYNIRNNPQHELAFHLGVESENIKGMTNANAATFYCPGNHDAHTGNVWDKATVEVNSDWWNTYWGLQNHSFKYGMGRFMVINNGWRWQDHRYQTDDAIEWLKGEGAGGNFFLSAAHHYDKMHDILDAHEPLDLVLSGHRHFISLDNPWEFKIGGDKVAYTAGSLRDKFEFILFRVNNSSGEYIPVAGKNGVVQVLNSGNKDDRSTWKPNLTLSYSNINDGSVTENTATIENKFAFPIMGARVRFVIPKGADYEIINGTIYQQFEGDLFQIIDVNTDIPAKSTKVVYLNVNVDLCPEDPGKTDLGLCGCGVDEGGCERSALIVNLGIGDGNYFPEENATIIADKAPKGQIFDSWVIVSGNPFIHDIYAPFTDLKLGGEAAEITATYKVIPIVLVNNAQFVSQYIPPMLPGEKVNVRLTMKNSGTSTWNNEGIFRLGSQNPQGNITWGFNRVFLNEDETVEPGSVKTFSFEVTAPQTKGMHRFQWRMVQENIQWFGDLSFNQHINIGVESGDVDDCDSLTDWGSSGSLSLNTIDHKQGGGSVVFTGSTIDEFTKKLETPISFVGSEADAILEFWYYISDPSMISGSNQVELGSGGKPDVNEYSWALVGLTEGWNYIRLKVSEAKKIGTPVLSSINWFRYYSFKSGSITSMIDGIKITGVNSSVNVIKGNVNDIVRFYPNPVFNDEVSVEFGLASFSQVSLSVLDMYGSLVSFPLYNHPFEPGSHKQNISLINIRPGTYFMQISINGIRQTRKMIVM